MNVSMLSQKLKDKLMSSCDVTMGSVVQYIDTTDQSQFVIMPEWFKEITSLPGIPFKFVTEFSGPPDSGKTTAATEALISAQKSGYVTVLVDAERKFSHSRFVKMGGDSGNLFVIQKPTIEETFEDLFAFLKAVREEEPEAKVLVVYDSIAVGMAKDELDKPMTENQTVADQARAIKRGIRKMLYYVQECNTAFLVINQVYKKIGFGVKGDQISGGQGIEYAKALAIAFRKRGEIKPRTCKGKSMRVGILTTVKTCKNHLQQEEMVVNDLILKVTASGMSVLTADKSKKGKSKVAEEISLGDDDDNMVIIEDADEGDEE